MPGSLEFAKNPDRIAWIFRRAWQANVHYFRARLGRVDGGHLSTSPLSMFLTQLLLQRMVIGA